MRTLRTVRLVLEPQVAAHADEMFGVLSDPAIYEYENAPPVSVDWLRERFTRLESRRSGDGSEQWLNWVVRLHDGPAIGYVQATVKANGEAAIAYELASAHWGEGLGSEAVRAMVAELGARYGVRELTAVFKRANHRSQRLLEKLGFAMAEAHAGVGADESLMRRAFEPPPPAPRRRITLADAMAVASMEGRVCPRADAWERLYGLLPGRRHDGYGAIPPLPPVHSTWRDSSDEDKRHRLVEHLAWAESHGAFGAVHEFLTTLAESQWHHVGD